MDESEIGSGGRGLEELRGGGTDEVGNFTFQVAARVEGGDSGAGAPDESVVGVVWVLLDGSELFKRRGLRGGTGRKVDIGAPELGEG